MIINLKLKYYQESQYITVKQKYNQNDNLIPKSTVRIFPYCCRQCEHALSKRFVLDNKSSKRPLSTISLQYFFQGQLNERSFHLFKYYLFVLKPLFYLNELSDGHFDNLIHFKRWKKILLLNCCTPIADQFFFPMILNAQFQPEPYISVLLIGGIYYYTGLLLLSTLLGDRWLPQKLCKIISAKKSSEHFPGYA